ncbi:methyltransferase domain-containing protein [Saccharopolyspora sp. HNM0983]|uniref:Methyltransferase domain-containing protein n=1 Tax=Saccharopolyspora montiporae TaxID=2781240 RepID=A0A929B7H3_9PSEU|nr:class I SAM-dependent methyltransferase [Saccharopolyspora sp. HNM0983]MBE9373651.1 methyltransferase domain-containing protein [Saccharopolyspora sp. HNM0983]
MSSEYVLDSGSALGREQLDHLDELLDAPTKQVIGTATAQPGQRCLEIGAGSGALSRWLAERTGPAGEVIAVDRETTHLHAPGARVLRHDINDGIPVEGTFDVIVARLVLMHLARRREILAELAAALAPGGWLVVGDQLLDRTRPVAAPTESDAVLFRSVIETTVDQVGRPGGIDYTWANALDGELVVAGLSEIDTFEFTRIARGGTAGCLLYGNYVAQVESSLRALGVAAADLDDFQRLMRDPAFRAWTATFVCTRGRKPAAS